MTQETTEALAADSGHLPLVEQPAGKAAPKDGELQTYLDFEIHVAAGQAWLAMPGHADCRAMYPDHARVLASALEQVAASGGERRIHMAHDASLVILRQGPDVILIREDTTARPDVRHAMETPSDAYRLARRIRDAADRAERSAWFGHAA